MKKLNLNPRKKDFREMSLLLEIIKNQIERLLKKTSEGHHCNKNNNNHHVCRQVRRKWTSPDFQVPPCAASSLASPSFHDGLVQRERSRVRKEGKRKEANLVAKQSSSLIKQFSWSLRGSQKV